MKKRVDNSTIIEHNWINKRYIASVAFQRTSNNELVLRTISYLFYFNIIRLLIVKLAYLNIWINLNYIFTKFRQMVTRRVPLLEQELFPFLIHMGTPLVVCWDSCSSLLVVFFTMDKLLSIDIWGYSLDIANYVLSTKYVQSLFLFPILIKI